MKNLKHSGIPIIYDIEEDNNSVCIIEEYISGNTLSSYISHNHNLSTHQICEIAMQICDILDYLHAASNQGIIHADLKPENVMIDENNQVKIIDFDHSVKQGQPRKNCMGTAGFASPEQYHRLKMDVYADIYAVGILLLYMTGNKDISLDGNKIGNRNIQQIIKKCIRHNKFQRYQSVELLKKELLKLDQKSGNRLDQKSGKKINESLVINVMASKHGSGSTHFCLCLAKYLNDRDKKAIYEDCTGDNGIISIVRYADITLEGLFKVNGIYILPDYNQCVQIKIQEQNTVIIRDYGINYGSDDKVLEEKLQFHTENEINIVIGSGKYYECEDLRKLLDKCHICVLNHMNGRQVYEFVSELQTECHVYRMPCVYDWTRQERAEIRMFEELINAELPEYNSVVHRRWRTYQKEEFWKTVFKKEKR